MAENRFIAARGGWRFGAARRIIGIDAGSRCIKVVLVEQHRAGPRLLEERLVDLEEEGVVSASDVTSLLKTVVDELGDHPVAITLPPHLVMSELIELPDGNAVEIRRAIDTEIVRVSGLSESAIIHDYIALEPVGPHKSPYWLTLCQEARLSEHLQRLKLPPESIAAITPAGTALFEACRVNGDANGNSVLVELGASTTTVVVCVDGQMVHASHLDVGSDYFTKKLAAINNSSFEVAETGKRSHDLLTSGDGPGVLREVVETWCAEVERVLTDWLHDHTELHLVRDTFRITVAGGGILQPGLAAFLTGRRGLRYFLWRWRSETGAEPADPRFALALGTAFAALDNSVPHPSLLPTSLRAARRNRQMVRRIEVATKALLVLGMIVLLVATVRQMMLLSQKVRFADKANAALRSARASEKLNARLAGEYADVRPILARRMKTLETLETFVKLQEVRTNATYWYVLFADAPTYFSTPIPIPAGQTNTPPQTNSFPIPPEFPPVFIAELTVPEEGDAPRRTVANLIEQLKKSGAFANVDALSEDRRRALAITNTYLPGRHFAMSIQGHSVPFAGSEDSTGQDARDGQPRSPGRTFRQRGDRQPDASPRRPQ